MKEDVPLVTKVFIVATIHSVPRNRMRKRSSIVWVVLMFVLFVTGCNQAEKQRQNAEAWRDLDAKMKLDNDELALKNARLEYEIIQTEFGDGVAQRWDKCLHNPPKVKNNQVACSKLLSQIKKKQDEAVVAEKVQAAKW